MLAEVGTSVVGLALAAALYAAFAVYKSIRRTDPRWARSGHNGIYAAASLLGLALLLLLAAFLGDQFEVRYVAQHSSRDLPLYLKASALWAGQEGSLLLWSFLQALFAALVVRGSLDDHRGWTAILLSLITAFFVGVTLFLSNPFALLDRVPADGEGLNPLLRHPGMIFHPPALYLGYVGLAVPFALAMAALITREVEGWTQMARRWTLASWLFLGLGLLLGARWAYDVLGWGGYWGWDPVENAGLMPWLTATALLHGGVMQEERKGFRVWNLLLVIFSFVLVLFGTFTTRSGMIQSVHAFGRSPLGPYFLAFIGVTLVGSLALLYTRRSLLSDPRSMDGFLSREGLFFLALVLFLTLTGSVLVGSTLPTLTEALTGQRFEAGPEWFDRVTGPQFAALVLVLGFCPLFGRAAQALTRLRSRGWPALVGAALAVLLAVADGLNHWTSLLGFGLVGLAGGTAVAEIAQGVAARSRREKEDLLRAVWSLIRHHQRRYGGYLVHIGVVLMAVGIIGTRMYPFETELVLSPGEVVDVGRYTLIFEDLRQEEAGDHFSTYAYLSAYRDGEYLATLTPRLDLYFGSDQTVGVPAVRAGLREDLYLVLAGYSSSSATLKMFVNPLAAFLWLGGLVFLAGGVVAVWPVSAVRLSVPQARRRAVRDGVALLAMFLLLTAAGVAMWGPGHGVSAQQTGRPLPGQPAPDFTLSLLDGSALRLSDLRGNVAVVNFWATWCPPCQEELPILQSLWAEYSLSPEEALSSTYQPEAVFLGLAYQDQESLVRATVARMGLTYRIGLDLDGRIARAYGITGVPETFIIDPQGQVAFVHIGPVTAEQLRGELDALLGR